MPRLWRRHGLWQIRMRWAVAPLMIAGVVVGRLFGFDFPLVPIAALALVNLAYNTLFRLILGRNRDRLRADPELDRAFTIFEVVLDYAAMFLLICFTGGASSPLIVFLIFHVVIAAIQFSAATAYSLAGVAASGLWIMLLVEAQGWLQFPHIALQGTSLRLEPTAAVVVTLAFFTATLFITAGMVSRITARLRERVGDLAEATSDCVRAYEAVQELMRERTEFMLEVAHNLRAPLTASLSILDLLTAGYQGELNDRQMAKLARLETRLRALDGTIGELLAIARARDRSREIEDVVADFDALARHTEEMFASEAAGKGLGFEVMADGDLPALPSGRGLLEQLMENLVSNAIKYTPEGGRIEVRFDHDDPGSVRITVADTGIGIPMGEQSKLFREFFRASNARKTTALGTGLGLVLAKQTVERHGGTLELTSAEGEGTTVVVTLPLERSF
ncbi:MAG: HAMP domain-containing histidine kinase [bacterium]|nr:HAMP domain-containing histidine kinase [bacterium]